MCEHFPNPKSSGGRVNVKLNIPIYGTKADLKNATGVDTSDFAKKTDLANLKSDVDKLDIDKLKKARSNGSNFKSKVDKLDVRELETSLVDSSKLSNAVKTNVVKKTEYDELVKKVNTIETRDTSDLVKRLTITRKLMKL